MLYPLSYEGGAWLESSPRGCREPRDWMTRLRKASPRFARTGCVPLVSGSRGRSIVSGFEVWRLALTGPCARTVDGCCRESRQGEGMSVVDVDRAGIARTAKKLGGEGTNVLLLRTSTSYDMSVLDAALPEDHGDSPANGGWSAGPKGWMLLIEGLDEQVDPWIEELARALGDGAEATPALGRVRLSRRGKGHRAGVGRRVQRVSKGPGFCPGVGVGRECPTRPHRPRLWPAPDLVGSFCDSSHAKRSLGIQKQRLPILIAGANRPWYRRWFSVPTLMWHHSAASPGDKSAGGWTSSPCSIMRMPLACS